MLLSRRTRLRKRERRRNRENLSRKTKREKTKIASETRKNKDATCAGSESRNWERDNRGITWDGPRLPIRWLTGDPNERDWQLSADYKHRPERAHSWSVAARSVYRSSCDVPVAGRLESRRPPRQQRAPIRVGLWIFTVVREDAWNHHTPHTHTRPPATCGLSSIVVHCARPPPPLACARCVVRQVTVGSRRTGKAFGKLSGTCLFRS